MVFSNAVFWCATAASIAGFLYTFYSFWVFHHDMDLPENVRDVGDRNTYADIYERAYDNIHEKEGKEIKRAVFKTKDNLFANRINIFPHRVELNEMIGSRETFKLPTRQENENFWITSQLVTNQALWEPNEEDTLNDIDSIKCAKTGR